MITRWTVSNFKSVSEETALSLSPLTILAGPNSSGKSTILQSLLLVSQTLAHKVNSRSVVLNGTLTRLGQFDDLKSHNSESDQITIGWECSPTEEAQLATTVGARFPGRVMAYRRRNDPIKEISCKLAFDTNPASPERDLFQLQPRLFLFTMSVLARAEDNTDRRCDVTVSRSRTGSDRVRLLEIEESDNEVVRTSLDYDVVLDENSLAELRENFPTADPVGCMLRHFLPEGILMRVNRIEEIAIQVLMVLLEEAPVSYRRVSFMRRELVIPEAVVRRLQTHLGDRYGAVFALERSISEIGPGLPAREWMDRVRRLPLQTRRELRRAIAECDDLQEVIADALCSEWTPGESEYRVLHSRPPADLQNASAYLGNFFSNSVKYLGPLRDEPKPLYPLAAHADPIDVGLRGEMTAAVLNINKDRLVRFVPSSAFVRSPFDPAPIVRSLEAAVLDWLKYLGVAETARSVDKGKLGHELKVTLAEGGPDYDLTHVGVGVSQVLPILVMALLADQDATLIFEQPELHLHPKVQTRLADFFLSIVLMGKQCLIETHSEYLVNRLRYRAAEENEGNRVTSNLKVYFVERISGSSRFREVKVNEYGAILDWPDGFFDQSQFESESILRAAAAKKKMQRGK